MKPTFFIWIFFGLFYNDDVYGYINPDIPRFIWQSLIAVGIGALWPAWHLFNWVKAYFKRNQFKRK